MNQPDTTQPAPANDLAELQRHIAELEGAVLQRDRAQEALRESEAELISIFRAAPIGIGMVINRIVMQVNNQLCRMTGYAAEELLGQSAKMLYPTHEDFEYVGQEKYRQIAEKGSGSVETRWRRKDGAVIDILLSSTLIEPGNMNAGVTFTAIDITEQKHAEENLRQSISLLRATLDSTADGILVVDNQGKIEGYNAKFVHLWRMPQYILSSGEDQLALEYVMDQLNDPQGFLARVQELYSLPEAASFDVLEFKDGRIIERYSLPQRIENRPVGRVWSFRDVTERRRAEEERRQLETKLRQAQKLESLGVLAGGIAHDFNNLLTAILGHASMALADLPPESSVRDSLRGIENAACRAAELCRQMLAYAGLGQFVVTPLNLSRLVQEIAHLLHVSISKKALMRSHFAENLPAIEADPAQIRQVVMNLVINASEAIGDNDGVIAISTGVMECDEAFFRECHLTEATPPGTYVYLEIADTGCGMDGETQLKIFDPFYTTKFTGRGLGLAAVLGIIRAHKGAIKVQSEPGKGTTFRALFPASAKQSAHADPDAATSLWRGSGAVLLVDDEEIVLNVAQKMLERCGFRVIMAADGREAIKIFKERADEIACVLLDLTMPHMDGAETYRELRRIRSDIRVILASGYNAQEIARRFAGQDLAGFIEKPYQLASLSAVLRKAFAPVEPPQKT
ncbi:MAG: PAS domain S-box protein [Candidatus Sumerlaeota bacterium]|nr:PAS domain S-box protein [Candidatus Sumerlaeota bacterium]